MLFSGAQIRLRVGLANLGDNCLEKLLTFQS